MPNTSARPLFTAEPEASRTAFTDEAVSAWNTLPTLKGRVAKSSTFVPADEREVADIVAKALTDAESVRESARTQASEIVSEATRAAERVRQDAFVDGYASGLNQARSEVAEELGAKFEQRCAELRDRVAEVVAAILSEREAMWNEMESELTTFALEIARKIVKTEVTQNPAVVEAVVRDGLRRITDRGTVRIVVNPDDIIAIRASRADLLEAIDGIENLIIDADRRVGRGGCVIETSAGSIDSKVETQLEQVEQAVRA